MARAGSTEMRRAVSRGAATFEGDGEQPALISTQGCPEGCTGSLLDTTPALLFCPRMAPGALQDNLSCSLDGSFQIATIRPSSDAAERAEGSKVRDAARRGEAREGER